MFNKLISYFKSGPYATPLTDVGIIKRLYEHKRWSVYLSLIFGYGFFYTCRLSLSVAKKHMVDDGILSVEQLGFIGAALFYVYAIGKFTNGFLADRANIRRFMSMALLLSAVANLLFGLTNGFWIFLALWGLNGWFQSIGSAPSVVSLCQWFSNNERGTRYGIWAGAHNIGEGLTFIGTSVLVASLGWRFGFLGPGLVCVVVAFILFKTLADRPQTYGLPPVNEYRNDDSAGKPSSKSTGALQLQVLKSPIVWTLGLSAALMYVTRYAIHSWGPFYLQTAKNYTVTEAGFLIGVNTMVGLAGAIFSGFLSDKYFNARRNMPTLLYGILLTGSLIAIYYIPPGHYWLDLIAIGGFEFAIGGLIVFLGGLIAVDIMPVRAAGGVKGVIGLFAYIGAGTQDWISGKLIQSGKSVVQGVEIYDFSQAFIFWIGASIASMLLATLVWNTKPKE
jgi:OPA family sugar phosphate sensor protein UhpC-like MFS transporter